MAVTVDTKESNLLDDIEELVSANDWPFERSQPDELTVWISGGWCTYQLWFMWRDQPDILYVSCSFDVKVPKRRRADAHHLLSLVNERTWIGHFALSPTDDLVTFRYAQMFGARKSAAAPSLDTLIEISLTECERYYPAFQFVLWGGKTPPQAMAAALLETQGEA
ncbi:MAG: hypothetical protein EXQ91_07840 [Alphaproteobacteria bacterium]|nr:hypothetical protein [Alphaproteobacteria bacterium]